MRSLQLNSCSFSILKRSRFVYVGRNAYFCKSVKENILIIYAPLMGHEERVPLCSKF